MYRESAKEDEIRYCKTYFCVPENIFGEAWQVEKDTPRSLSVRVVQRVTAQLKEIIESTQ